MIIEGGSKVLYVLVQYMVLLQRKCREKGCFNGIWTSRHRFGDGSKQVVFLLKLLDKLLKKRK